MGVILGDGPIVVTLPRDRPVAQRVPRPVGHRSTVVPIVGPVGPEGPAGPRGPAGPAFTGTSWWFGEGPPDLVVGSKVGDRYMDLDTGIVYTLRAN